METFGQRTRFISRTIAPILLAVRVVSSMTGDCFMALSVGATRLSNATNLLSASQGSIVPDAHLSKKLPQCDDGDTQEKEECHAAELRSGRMERNINQKLYT